MSEGHLGAQAVASSSPPPQPRRPRSPSCRGTSSAGPRFVAPSDKVNVALIGVGRPGPDQRAGAVPGGDCQVIAVADPAEEWDLSAYYYGGKGGRAAVRAEIEKTYAAKTPNFRCSVYEDFRVMLEKEKAIDAVLIATPDHLHGYVAITAMKAGKHVYCEKPLTNSVWEARQVARVAAETGVATQMGNQGRSSEGHRLTAEWIWDGAIGAVREVHAWNRSPASFGVIWRPAARPSGTHPMPAGPELGPLARTAQGAPLASVLRACHLARVLGLRRRPDARHGHPPPRSRLQRARPRDPGDRRSDRLRRRGPGAVLARPVRDLALRGDRQARSADGPLVRRRADAADAARHRPRGSEAEAGRGRGR